MFFMTIAMFFKTPGNEWCFRGYNIEHWIEMGESIQVSFQGRSINLPVISMVSRQPKV